MARSATRGPDNLTAKETLFIAEYLANDFNGTHAVLKAGYKTTYQGATSLSAQILSKPKIQKAIQSAITKRVEKIDLKAEDIIRSYSQIASADRNDLVELRRECCRYCHGRGHNYQYTVREMEQARVSHEISEAKKQARCEKQDEAYEYTEFDEKGGIGFNPHKDPSPDCPECFGDGKTRTYFKDTRKLSDAARTVFEGVKQTKGGLELILASRTDALDKLARHFSLFNDKLKVEWDLSALTDEELDQLERIQAKLSESRSDQEGED